MCDKIRCSWAGNDPLYVVYHDTEWGVPLHDDHKHFEFLILESFQAGLSWLTILRKRENFRQAFAGFKADKVALFDQNKIAELMLDAGIIRNRLKIQSAITNAQKFLEIQDKYGSFDKFIWQFTNFKTLDHQFENLSQLPAATDEAKAMSKELNRLGFKFVGPTICYANMQAIGMVNDHLLSCFRHQEVGVSPMSDIQKIDDK